MIFSTQVSAYESIRHYFKVFKTSEAKIRPHFHVTGGTGTGKTFLIKAVAAELELPVVEINAAGITAEGVSGNSLSKALKPLRTSGSQPTIIFIDEFDKLFLQNGTNTENWVSSVQDEFLKAVEGDSYSVFGDYGNYDTISLENCLFIFAGSYGGHNMTKHEDFHKAGIRPEFMGRVPLFLSIPPVDVKELADSVPRIQLFRDYCSLFGINQEQQNLVTMLIADTIMERGTKIPVGIRAINSAIHQAFMNSSLEVPDKAPQLDTNDDGESLGDFFSTLRKRYKSQN